MTMMNKKIMKSFKDFIKENTYVTAFKGITLVKNPNSAQTANSIKKWGGARVMVHPENNDVYMFNNFEHTHHEVAGELSKENIHLDHDSQKHNFIFFHDQKTNTLYHSNSKIEGVDNVSSHPSEKLHRSIKGMNLKHIHDYDSFEMAQHISNKPNSDDSDYYRQQLK